MPTRLTFLMQLTTDPANRNDASPHTGGWSESFWAFASIPASDPDILILARKRALLLPAQASLVGFRLSNYNVSGNRLIPTGSSTGKLQLPGATSRQTDVPQMALEMSGKSIDTPNSTRIALRCIPDEMVSRGEYQPDLPYKTLVTGYANEIIAKGWKFLGRNLSLPSLKVNSIAGNVVTLDAAIGAVDGVTWVRFRRVYDDAGNPVKGSFLVSNHVGNTITLQGFPVRTLTTPSGTARIDGMVLCAFGGLVPARIVVRKIGRPFESYRGRQSKKTA